jgi:hypothetical protein
MKTIGSIITKSITQQQNDMVVHVENEYQTLLILQLLEEMFLEIYL